MGSFENMREELAPSLLYALLDLACRKLQRVDRYPVFAVELELVQEGRFSRCRQTFGLCVRAPCGYYNDCVGVSGGKNRKLLRRE